ncbi:DUF1905 domain-containing protein [Chryseolinea lacunae]|uniref:DUF1905 domain-containing protein n=1 Tax=Chryseolinea lacunae TaxID=2801331 RepID=A0ABS1KR66_9BACT|nr:YdeI/OmpD-associated family protein [Chryseolinea lacunae]MBL0740781.1 DUF1905 domain-containing protein [Chryseolinea lacunae]
MLTFRARIYKTGINTCVDMPEAITKKMPPTKGRIHVKGTVNGFAFTKTLVPVKGKPFRLFVNAATLKGADTTPGEVARFTVQQVLKKVEKKYAMPPRLRKELSKHSVLKNFGALTPARQKDILKYLSFVTNEATVLKHAEKIISKLKAGEKNVRIP